MHVLRATGPVVFLYACGAVFVRYAGEQPG
jgi:hypothetical protein